MGRIPFVYQLELAIGPSVCLSCLSASLSVSVFLSARSSFCPSAYLSIFLCVRPPGCLSYCVSYARCPMFCCCGTSMLLLKEGGGSFAFTLFGPPTA